MVGAKRGTLWGEVEDRGRLIRIKRKGKRYTLRRVDDELPCRVRIGTAERERQRGNMYGLRE